MTKVVNNIAVATPQTGSGFYTVKSGDSLWKIAEAAYGHGHGAKYQEIFDANKPLLKDPDKIFPGQVLRIPQAADGTAPQASAATQGDGRRYSLESAHHLSEWTQFSTARGAKAARRVLFRPSSPRKTAWRWKRRRARRRVSDGSRAKRRRSANPDSQAPSRPRYGLCQLDLMGARLQARRGNARSCPAAAPSNQKNAWPRAARCLIADQQCGVVYPVAQRLQAQRRETLRGIGGKEPSPASEMIQIFSDDAAVVERRAVLQHKRGDFAERILRANAVGGLERSAPAISMRSVSPNKSAAMRTLRA